jgi:hypothetical protein
VEADVLLGREVLVEARLLKDDPDLAADGTGLRGEVVAGNAHLPTRGGESGRQDRDDRRLAGAIRA